MFDRMTIQSPVYSGRDFFAVADTDGFAAEAKLATTRHHGGDWLGGMTYAQALTAARDGYKPGVAASDALLEQFSDLDLSTRRWRTLEAVAGGAPNVGAFLAGSPVAMRRRERQLTEAAPMTILVDVMSSCGVPADALIKRAAACLALVRALSANRPTTAYMVGGDGIQRTAPATFCAVRMDTTMDLSRAAFFLGHPAAARGLLYAVQSDRVPGNGQRCERGCWAWGDHKAYVKHAPALFAQAIGVPVEDCLYLAPPHLQDPAITQPAQWVKDMLARHGGAPVNSD